MQHTDAIREQIKRIILDQPDLLSAALGCKAGGFDPVGCAAQLYNNYPTTAAGDMANVIVQVWACETSSTVLTQALGACMNGSSPAYTAAQISSAVSASLHLTWLDYTQVGNSRSTEIGLFQGDLTTMAAAETVPILVISTLPNDYAPTPGTLIAALANKGVSVATLAQNKAGDYRQQNSCWFSQAITGQSFGRILCFESTSANAPSAIPGIFSALKAFQPTPPMNLTLASAMLSTGDAGAQPAPILTALFNAAKSCMNGGYALAGFKVVVYQSSWTASMTQLFDQLKAA